MPETQSGSSGGGAGADPTLPDGQAMAQRVAAAMFSADRASRELARGLLGLGVGRGAHVGLCFPTGIEFVVAWLAVVRIGAVAVPISTFSTADEIATLVRNADLRAQYDNPQ